LLLHQVQFASVVFLHDIQLEIVIDVVPVNFSHVFWQLAPSVCSLDGLNETDLTNRAHAMLHEAEKIGCRKFLTPKDVVEVR
jgi:hypothetical protein